MKTKIRLIQRLRVPMALVIIPLLCSGLLKAQSPSFAWAKQLNGTGTDNGNDIALGNLTGSIYTTGGFSGLADFDKNGGGWYLNSAGNRDIFISKTDAGGNMIWLKRIGGVNDDIGIHICVDNLENVYVSGRFTGTVDFDPGTGVSNLSSATQASFILKLTGAGNFAYAYQYGGPSLSVSIANIQTDATNNLIAAGQLNGTWDFDPGVGVFTLSAFQVGYILKLTASGALIFARQIAASSPEYNGIAGMCLDPSGNIIVTGNLQGTADFDLGAGTVMLTSSSASINNDYFVAKYTSAGNYLWAGLTGGTSTTHIFSGNCITDLSGNIYICSESFGGTVDFDITAGVNMLSTTNGSQWVQKIKSNGTCLWAKKLEPGIDVNTIKTNSTSGLYIEGSFRNTCDFDPGPGVYSLTNSSVSNAYYDVYVLKLDTAFNFQWAKGFGAAYDDSPGNFCVTASDNVITTGSFTGAGDFDPNVATANLFGKGSTDIFIQKLNGSGSLTWVYNIGTETSIAINAVSARVTNLYSATGSLYSNPATGNFNHHGGNDIMVVRGSVTGSFGFSYCMGGPGNDAGTGIISDANDNIYLTGYFEQTADFAPSRFKSSYPLTSAGAKDIVVLKINASGNLVWAKRMGGNSDDQSTAITLDNSGNLFVTGFFQGTADFDPGAGTSNLVSAGNTDAFILKMDTAGNFIWAKNAGGTSSDMGNAVAADASGNVIITGSFYATADFDPSAAVTNLISLGNGDGFVLKLNSSGGFLWAKQIGSNGNDFGQCITTDGSDIIIGGSFGNSTDFDPGPGIFTITPPNGNGEIFIQKLTAAGNFVFAKSMGGAGSDRVSGIALDAAGNIYSTGFFSGTADLNPQAAVSANFTSNGATDVYINCYNANLDISWTKTLGGAQSDAAAGIAVDASNNIYAAGSFSDIVDFNPDAGIHNLTAPGENDIFALKLIQSSPLPVELIEFTAAAVENKKVFCKWTTASEQNNDYFTVERSKDGEHFEAVGKVQGHQTNSSLQDYSETDAQPLMGISYYRLKQTDFNGAFTYSNMARVFIDEKAGIFVYPNPVKDFINIKVESDQSVSAAVTLMDISGKIIMAENVAASNGIHENKFNLEQLPAGLYFLAVRAGNMQRNIRITKY